MNDHTPTSSRKSEWAITPEAFNRFLQWLDQGSDSSGEAYLLIRKRLVDYFDRKDCLNPDDLADETINRVARRLEEERSIAQEIPAKYCYTMARFVFLEYLRDKERKGVSLDDSPESGVFVDQGNADERSKKESMLECLERCTRNLDKISYSIITRYYHGKEREKIDNRRRMADELRLSMNALSIRACRIREKLYACVNECMQKM